MRTVVNLLGSLSARIETSLLAWCRGISAPWIARYIAAIHWFIPERAQQDASTLTRAQNVINAVVMAALAGPFYAAAYYGLGFTLAAQEILLCCALCSWRRS